MYVIVVDVDRFFMCSERGQTTQIHKILNNNVVVVLDEQEKEQVVMGRGLAFKKKCGDEIDPAQIDKVFTMSNPDTNNKFQEIVANIPLEYMLLVEDIITYAKTHIGKKINDSIYISLADHIFMSVLDDALTYCFNDQLKDIVYQLKQLMSDLTALGYGKHITFDLGKVPHLNYYSGLLFEGFVEGIGTSVLSGGRYDHLLEKFGKPMPAIGFSVKLDYLLEVYELTCETKKTIQILYPLSKQLEALQKAKTLRKDYRVELLPQEREDIEVKEVMA